MTKGYQYHEFFGLALAADPTVDGFHILFNKCLGVFGVNEMYFLGEGRAAQMVDCVCCVKYSSELFRYVMPKLSVHP